MAIKGARMSENTINKLILAAFVLILIIAVEALNANDFSRDEHFKIIEIYTGFIILFFGKDGLAVTKSLVSKASN